MLLIGLNLLVARHPDEIDLCKEEAVKDLARELGRIKLQDRGVLVQASTLGSLEALLEFLKDSKIPVSRMILLSYLSRRGKIGTPRVSWKCQSASCYLFTGAHISI
jgi:translation initiation factor IF-2